MASFDYPNAQKTALGLIAKFGQSAQLVRFSTEPYDPVTGRGDDVVELTTDATVVTLPASSEGVQAFDNRFNEDLRKGKIRFFYVAAKGLGFEPVAGDMILFEGTLWDIAGGTPLNPAGLPVYYTFGCRSSGKVIPAGDSNFEFEFSPGDLPVFEFAPSDTAQLEFLN